MKRALLLVPCLGLTAFGGYFHHWNTAYTTRLEDIASRPLAIYNYRDGRIDAEADLARDHLRLLTYGWMPPEMPEYQDLLNRIYRLQIESITDNPTLEVKRYAADYNAVMRRHIIATFGPHALADARELARRRHALNGRIASYVPPP